MKKYFVVIFVLFALSKGENLELESAVLDFIEKFNDGKDFHVHFMESSRDFPTENFFEVIYKNLQPSSIGKKLVKGTQILVIFDLNDLNDLNVIKDVKKFYLIVLEKPENITDIFKSIWTRRNLLNINIMIENKKKIELVTFFPFSENHCNNTETIKVINEFVDGKWKSEKFFPNKISNFHGCTLRLAIAPAYPATVENRNKNGSVNFSGSDIKIASELAKRLNFNQTMTNRLAWGDVYENGTATKIFADMRNRLYDYGVGWYFLTGLKGKYFDFVQPYFFVPIVLVVPPGKNLYLIYI